MASHAMQQMSSEMQQCIQNCMECHRICTEMVSHCLSLGGQHAESPHITLLLDCANICATSADFMIRGSQYHGRTCGVCAEVCAACADDCERIAGGDEMMMRCVEVCRRCADSCKQMASMGA